MSTQIFDFCIINTTLDYVLILKPYCEICANKKIGEILKKYEIDVVEAKPMLNYIRKPVKIKCECYKKLINNTEDATGSQSIILF